VRDSTRHFVLSSKGKEFPKRMKIESKLTSGKNRELKNALPVLESPHLFPLIPSLPFGA
jgi:hypothetical protein